MLPRKRLDGASPSPNDCGLRLVLTVHGKGKSSSAFACLPAMGHAAVRRRAVIRAATAPAKNSSAVTPTCSLPRWARLHLETHDRQRDIAAAEPPEGRCQLLRDRPSHGVLDE